MALRGSRQDRELRVDPLRVRDWAEPELRFTEMPSQPLASFLGKKGYSRRARLKHRGDRSVLVYEHFPLIWLVVCTLLVGVAVAALLLNAEQLGLRSFTESAIFSILAGYGGLFIPMVAALFHRSNLRYLGYGDLLAVTAGDETVTLQDGKIALAWGDLRAVTEVRGYFCSGRRDRANSTDLRDLRGRIRHSASSDRNRAIGLESVGPAGCPTASRPVAAQLQAEATGS